MMKALIWKEWCEQRWKLAFGCVLIGGFAAVSLRARIWPDIGVTVLSAMFGSALMALFVSMGLFACERNEGTLGTLLVLPVEKWKVFAVKMGVGALVCAGPVILVGVLVFIIGGGRELSARQTGMYFSVGIVFGVAAFVWMAVFGVRRASETKAGLVGIAVLVGWFLFFGFDDVVRIPWLRWWLQAVLPLQFDLTSPHDILKRVLVQSAVVSGLLVWGCGRFGKEGRVEK